MRAITAFLSICCSTVVAFEAHAQCYGDAADAYGCGSTFKAEGTLERFGGGADSGAVIPDYGYGRYAQNPADNLFSPEEERRMYKSIVLGNRNSIGSGYQNRAYSANSRSLRTFRSHRIGGRRLR